MKRTKNAKTVIFALALLAACLLASCRGIGDAKAPENAIGMYDEYTLTEEDLAELNEAYFRDRIKNSGVQYSEEELKEMRESKYCKFAETVEAAMSRPAERPHNGGHYYVGKFGDCIVYFNMGNESISIYPDILYACYDSQIYYLKDAYSNGWLSAEDIERINDICAKTGYYDGGLIE